MNLKEISINFNFNNLKNYIMSYEKILIKLKITLVSFNL